MPKPKNCKAAGTAREHRVKHLLEADGWIVIRAPASLGAADLIAHKRGHPTRWIQVKANRAGGPYANFRPAERRELAQVARQAGGVAELCWWPPRGQCEWIPHARWPLPANSNNTGA